MMGEDTVNIGDLIAGLLGGVALLLFGMGRITDAMKLIAGERLKVSGYLIFLSFIYNFASRNFSALLARPFFEVSFLV